MIKENLFNYGISTFAISNKNKHWAISYKDKNEINIFKLNNFYNLDDFNLIFCDKNYLIPPSFLEYSKDETLLLSISCDKNIFIYKLNSNKYKLNICLINGLLKSPVMGTWSENNFFVTACSEGSLYYSEYDKQQNMWIGNIFKNIKGSILFLRYNNSNDKLCVGGTDKIVRIINANKKELTNSTFGETLFKIKCNHWIFIGLFSPVDDYLIINDFENNMKLIDIKSNKIINEFKFPDKLLLNKGVFINNNTFILTGFDKKPFKFTITNNIISFTNELNNQNKGYYAQKELNSINKLQLEQLKKYIPKELKQDQYHLKEINNIQVSNESLISMDSKGCYQHWDLI